jgi:lysozyme
MRTRLLLLILAVFMLVPSSAALGYPNGQWPPSALDHISGGLNHAGNSQPAYLAKGAVSADFNTFNLCATADGVPITPGPSSYQPAATAYRSYAIQVILKRELGANAATPGHSNHGNARAVDLRTLQMRGYIDKHGGRFGISKRTSDAAWEWWHLLIRPELVGFHRPDPGASFRFPNVQVGSGGKCQAPAVREVQVRVGVKPDGEFGKATLKALHVFERQHHMKRTNHVTSVEWLRLRKADRALSNHTNPRTVGPVKGSVAPMAGQDVRAVQGLLNNAFKAFGRPQYQVKVDGVTDAKFAVAVRRFQVLANRRGANLKVTGIADDATYAALLKSIPKPTQVIAVTGEGAGLVASFEGFRSCPYQDVVHVWTIAYGHTAGVGPHTPCVSQKRGLIILQADLDLFSKGVTKLVHVRIGSREFNALVSWSFNVGLGAAGSSTLMRELNAGHFAAAGNEFKRWNRAGGRVFLGLSRRRRAECELYKKGVNAATKRAIHC